MCMLCLAAMICLFLSAFGEKAGAKKKQVMTVAIPTEVIADFIKGALPIALPSPDGFSGKIYIRSLENVALLKDALTCKMGLLGKNIAYQGPAIGFQPLQLNLGTLTADFSCRGNFEFDPKKQVLYLTPQIVSAGGEKSLGVNPMTGALNDVKIPIDLGVDAPILTKVGENALWITPRIVDVRSISGKLILDLLPAVSRTDPSVKEGKKNN